MTAARVRGQHPVGTPTGPWVERLVHEPAAPQMPAALRCMGGRAQPHQQRPFAVLVVPVQPAAGPQQGHQGECARTAPTDVNGTRRRRAPASPHCVRQLEGPEGRVHDLLGLILQCLDANSPFL